jgi:putative transposase
MKTVCEVLDVARSNIAVRVKAPLAKPIGRPPEPEADLVVEIKALIGEMPTYGYRRVWAVLRRAALVQGRQPPNHKRVYRVMKAYGLLLQRRAGGVVEPRHDGRIAVDRSNLRWCSDGFELACDNGEKVSRVAFALNCCDREAMGFIATTDGIKGEDVSRPHGHGRRASVRAGQPIALDHRMVDRQRLWLHRP